MILRDFFECCSRPWSNEFPSPLIRVFCKVYVPNPYLLCTFKRLCIHWVIFLNILDTPSLSRGGVPSVMELSWEWLGSSFWTPCALHVYSVHTRSAPARWSAVRVCMELTPSSEANPKPGPTSFRPMLGPSVCAFLPLYSRLPFAKVPLLGLFTEVYAGHMRIGTEGRVREGGLKHGIGRVFRTLGTPTSAFLLPLFCRLLSRG
jgi:hypothetical protein